MVSKISWIHALHVYTYIFLVFFQVKWNEEAYVPYILYVNSRWQAMMTLSQNLLLLELSISNRLQFHLRPVYCLLSKSAVEKRPRQRTNECDCIAWRARIDAIALPLFLEIRQWLKRNATHRSYNGIVIVFGNPLIHWINVLRLFGLSNILNAHTRRINLNRRETVKSLWWLRSLLFLSFYLWLLFMKNDRCSPYTEKSLEVAAFSAINTNWGENVVAWARWINVISFLFYFRCSLILHLLQTFAYCESNRFDISRKRAAMQQHFF